MKKSRMKRIIKWIGLGVGGLFILLLLVAVGLAWRASSRLNRNYAITPEAVSLPTDATAIAEGHKAEQLRPKEQLVHTNLSLFYMKSGDKQTAEHHGLQARIASWREDKSPPGTAPAGDPELALAKPAPPPMKPPEKFPDMPWKKK